ncbi:hypothetical protein GQ55_2G484400 [Panicum hallii var. hallii]|uniref:Uncharacterized protein n=1 Tax=Panicum hallii var. hallii TaxID=1504633 RepID=A0A2T7F0I1_9POAL|nr:hypothetical protein GQ55_2G484400 [Panicum hallii var. hallii]
MPRPSCRCCCSDDTEAFLEGTTAMAGLVAILRQLGDLAELAAEVLDGLQDQAMANLHQHQDGGGLKTMSSDIHPKPPPD